MTRIVLDLFIGTRHQDRGSLILRVNTIGIPAVYSLKNNRSILVVTALLNFKAKRNVFIYTGPNIKYLSVEVIILSIKCKTHKY